VGPARGRPRYYERYREQQAPPNAHLYTFFIPPEYLQVIGRGREVEPDFEAFCTCLTRISGVSFDEAVEEHVASVYGIRARRGGWLTLQRGPTLGDGMARFGMPPRADQNR
jgi:hypothetical protein